MTVTDHSSPDSAQVLEYISGLIWDVIYTDRSVQLADRSNYRYENEGRIEAWNKMEQVLREHIAPAQAAGKKIPDCGDLKDFVNILRVWPAHEGHDALAAHYVSELMNDAADFLEALAGRATADSEQAAREMQRAVLTDAMIEAAWHAYQSTGIDLLADSDEETKKCMVEGLKAALGASTQPQAETGTGDLVNRLLAAPVTLKTGREAAAVIAELEAENKRLRAEPQAAVLTDLQCWKDGRLVACDLPDFIRSLRRYSGWADEQFGTRSDAAAHLGERLSAAIGAIAALSRPTLPQAAPSRDEIAAQVLLAMSDKVGSDTYNSVSHALKINKERAGKAADAILALSRPK